MCVVERMPNVATNGNVNTTALPGVTIILNHDTMTASSLLFQRLKRAWVTVVPGWGNDDEPLVPRRKISSIAHTQRCLSVREEAKKRAGFLPARDKSFHLGPSFNSNRQNRMPNLNRAKIRSSLAASIRKAVYKGSERDAYVAVGFEL